MSESIDNFTGIAIASCNVGRRLDAHDALLASCSSSQLDMILVQEPWIFSDLTLKRTRAHPGYRVFLPAGPWNRRPRVCTYVKDSLASYASQLQAPSPGQPDLLPVHFHTLTLDFTLWNVYNAPDGDGVVAPRAASTALLQQSFPNSHILCGDFNFPTGSWLPHQSGTTESERFHDHMLTQDLANSAQIGSGHFHFGLQSVRPHLKIYAELDRASGPHPLVQQEFKLRLGFRQPDLSSDQSSRKPDNPTMIQLL